MTTGLRRTHEALEEPSFELTEARPLTRIGAYAVPRLRALVLGGFPWLNWDGRAALLSPRPTYIRFSKGFGEA